jgi:hypothetical protein
VGWGYDHHFSEKYEMKYTVKKRKEQMMTKKNFHEKLFKILDADNIGENLKPGAHTAILVGRFKV